MQKSKDRFIAQQSMCQQQQLITEIPTITIDPKQTQNMSLKCPSVEHKTKCHKICISSECLLQNPFICEECQQLHEHSGTISAVRAVKVKEMLDALNKAQVNKASKLKQLLRIRDEINKKINEKIQQVQQGQSDGVPQLCNKLNQVLQTKQDVNFQKLWTKSKQYTKNIPVSSSKPQQQLNQFKAELLNIISSTNQNKEAESTSIINSQQETFLDGIAPIFCNLQLELKSSFSPFLVEKLKNTQQSTKSALLVSAKLLQIHNELDAALQMYSKILAQTPLDLLTITRKATLLEKHKKYQQAYDQYVELLDLIGNKANTQHYRFHLGLICRELERFDQAIKEFYKCKGKYGVNQHDLYHAIASVYEKQNKFEQAIITYKKCLEISKDQQNEDTYRKILECSNSLPNPNLTLNLTCLEFLLNKNPSQFQLLLKRAKIHHQTKSYDKAVQDYSLAITKVDNMPGLYFNRAVMLIYLGQNEKAIPDLQKTLQLDPNFKQAVHLLANTCFQIAYGKNKKQYKPQAINQLRTLAMNSYQYCLSFYKNSQGIWHNLGVLHAQSNPQKAYQCFVKALEINPKLQASYLGKIKTAMIIHKDPVATMKDVQTLISLGDRTVSLFLIKCSLQQQLKRYEDALQTVTMVLTADPQNKTAIETKLRIIGQINKSKNVQSKVSQQQNKHLQKIEITENVQKIDQAQTKVQNTIEEDNNKTQQNSDIKTNNKAQQTK